MQALREKMSLSVPQRAMVPHAVVRYAVPIQDIIVIELYSAATFADTVEVMFRSVECVTMLVLYFRTTEVCLRRRLSGILTDADDEEGQAC